MEPRVVKQVIQGLTDMAENYLVLGELEKAVEVLDLVDDIESGRATSVSNVVSLDVARAKREQRSKSIRQNSGSEE